MYHHNPIKRSFHLTFFLMAILLLQSCSGGSESAPASDDPYNGLRRSFRKDGTLLAEVMYKDSIRDGLARNFYRNGTVQLEVDYVKGIRHGNSISYYENGDVYLVTPFVHGSKHGIEKKYYQGNKLMAEIPYENNEQIEGIKEYNKEGKMITREAKIVFRLEDKTAFENKFDLVIQLSDGSTHAQFYRYYPVKEGDPPIIHTIFTEKGKAIQDFYLLPGHSHMERIFIIAERKTRLGNKEVFKASYNLAIENSRTYF